MQSDLLAASFRKQRWTWNREGRLSVRLIKKPEKLLKQSKADEWRPMETLQQMACVPFCLDVHRRGLLKDRYPCYSKHQIPCSECLSISYARSHFKLLPCLIIISSLAKRSLCTYKIPVCGKDLPHLLQLLNYAHTGKPNLKNFWSHNNKSSNILPRCFTNIWHSSDMQGGGEKRIGNFFQGSGAHPPLKKQFTPLSKSSKYDSSAADGLVFLTAGRAAYRKWCSHLQPPGLGI